MTDTPFQFVYPANARELPRRDSPIAARYHNDDPRLIVTRSGVVTTDPLWQDPATHPTTT